MSKTKIETKTLDHSDVKYGILRINSGEIASCLPTFYYPITVHDDKNNEDYKRHMHLSVRNRIDGFTNIYKTNSVVEGDTIIMQLQKEDEDGKTKYILQVSFQKREKSDTGEIIKEQWRNVPNNGELTNKEKKELEQEIEAIKDKIKIREYYFYRNEANVRAEIVERILAKLKWSFPELEREVKGYGLKEEGDRNIKVDYALYDKPAQEPQTCKALIEVKSIDVSFDKEDSMKQLKGYLDDLRFKSVPIGILTNGRTWIIYKRVKSEQSENETTNIQEIMRTDITVDGAYSFFEWLRIGKIEELIDKGTTSIDCVNNQEEFDNKGITIKYDKDNVKIISDNNASEAFRQFVKKEIKIVYALQEDNRFPTKILIDKKKGDKINVVKTPDGKEWSINTYSDTHQKLMLIKQIITEGNIEATADYFTE